MRIYANCMEMHSEVKRDLHEMGIKVHPQTMQDKQVADNPDFETLELSPCDFTILDGRDRDDLLVHTGKRLDWAKAEFEERVDGGTHNPGSAWELRRETWAQFIHNGEFAYTYSERFGQPLHSKRGEFCGSPLDIVVRELREHPDTRQAILPMFDGYTDLPNLGGKARVPCTLQYQFLIRAGELRMIYTMRSSDFATHFPYDIWLALQLQEYVASVLTIAPGRFTFFTGSLHLYAKDADPGTF